MDDFVLICSVGGSPEPIRKSIDQQRPRFVVYVASPASRKTIRKDIEDGLAWQGIEDTHVITLSDYQDLLACVRDIRNGLTTGLQAMSLPEDSLLVADITVKNTFEQSIEMYDTDFQVQWDDGDDAYAYPITTDMETYTEVEPVGENQLPGTYPMAVDEERSGELVYEVPSGFTDFSIAYLEQFVDDSGEESTGETFFVYFTAEDQTGASA